MHEPAATLADVYHAVQASRVVDPHAIHPLLSRYAWDQQSIYQLATDYRGVFVLDGTSVITYLRLGPSQQSVAQRLWPADGSLVVVDSSITRHATERSPSPRPSTTPSVPPQPAAVAKPKPFAGIVPRYIVSPSLLVVHHAQADETRAALRYVEPAGTSFFDQRVWVERIVLVDRVTKRRFIAYRRHSAGTKQLAIVAEEHDDRAWAYRALGVT